MAIPILSILIATPIAASPAIYFLGARDGRLARYTTLVLTFSLLLASLYMYSTIFYSGGGKFQFVEGPYPWVTGLRGFDYHVGADGLGAPLVLLSTIVTFLAALGSLDLIHTQEGPYYALLLLFEGAMVGVFTALNLVLFYIFWEVVLIPMFFFIGVWGGPNRRYAAMKFLIFTFVGSIIMLLGFVLIYFLGPRPTLSMLEIQADALAGRLPFWLQAAASLAFFAGFGVKLPVVPLHTWLPDAHVEAPSPISVLLAGLLLKMGGYGFIRLSLGLLPDAARAFAPIYIGLGIMTMFYGAIVAMIQSDLKRMVALTSINHMGFVLLGTFTGNSFGLQGAVFQMFNHGVSIGILFMLAGYIHEQAGTRQITELKGLKELMPRTAALLTLGSLAGMGVPVFSTFISEWMVIFGAISINAILAVTALIPGITVAYFLWMLKRAVYSPLMGARGHDMSLYSAFSLTGYLVPLVILLAAPSLVLGVVGPLALEMARLLVK